MVVFRRASSTFSAIGGDMTGIIPVRADNR
jgi:hypothetical protein